MITYRQAGVDIAAGNIFIKKIRGQKINQRVRGFASLFDLKALSGKYRQPVLVSSCDGVGTKLKIAQSAGIHNTVGIDLVAMNVNDLICMGAKPLFFLDYIACGRLNVKTLTVVMAGIKRGLKSSACQLIGGETAEMPGMYKNGEYDLAGFCVGVVDKDKIIDGNNIKPGDLIIGLASSGLHSNGFSLVRRALGKKEIKQYAKELLKPTRIYVKPILSLLSTVHYPPSTIKGIAHITGGAFYNKATKILPKDLGMIIHKNTWKVPPIFKLIQDKGRISDKEMHTVFNMGIGMILVVGKNGFSGVQTIISKYKIKSYLIGEIVQTKKKMEIV